MPVEHRSNVPPPPMRILPPLPLELSEIESALFPKLLISSSSLSLATRPQVVFVKGILGFAIFDVDVNTGGLFFIVPPT